jgi:hypothetical protein
MLTLQRRKTLRAERDALNQRAKDRVAEARAHGLKLAAKTMTYAEMLLWQEVEAGTDVKRIADARRAKIGTDAGGFTFESTIEVREFIAGVDEVVAELGREPKPEELTEEERDARFIATGGKIIDPDGAERRMQERREARRAQIADYERRKAAGEDVEYPA